MHSLPSRNRWPFLLLAIALIATVAIYWPGLHGTWLFDDYPNIVDNKGVQPADASTPSLVRAALSSPSSEFKRPLASLSFAANYLASGLDPFWWKLTNLVIHLLNGLLVFWLTRLLSRVAMFAVQATPTASPRAMGTRRSDITAALIAGAWMLLPINLTGVLYVVQRMESMANAFVLLGLIGYVIGRQRMLSDAPSGTFASQSHDSFRSWRQRGLLLCLISITVPTALGLLAKETAVMLPLYTLLIEWALFRFHGRQPGMPATSVDAKSRSRDSRVISLFIAVLALPMVTGLAWMGPRLLDPATWATRSFTLGTRLLSEARIVVDYIGWILLPTPSALSFYHDNFQLSTGLLTPWTTLASIACLLALLAFAVWVRPRRPLVALGIALFLGCQLLTGTILPLELIYEHRNYFASFGLLLAIVPLLAAPRSAPATVEAHPVPDAISASVHEASRAECASTRSLPLAGATSVAIECNQPDALPFALPRYVLLVGLLLCWTALTAFTAYTWGDPLRLAADLAARAPQSPRAQYELGRTYIIYSRYDRSSPFTPLAYAPLERAAALPGSSILPEQALIFMNARMGLPQKDTWWDSLVAKLKARPLGVQDESSLGALTQCAREGHCDLPADRMVEAFTSALSHPNPGAHLLATYGDYAWNVLDDHALGERMIREAVQASPDEPAYQITLIRMLAAQQRTAEATSALKQLESLNTGGRLNSSLNELRKLLSQ